MAIPCTTVTFPFNNLKENYFSLDQVTLICCFMSIFLSTAYLNCPELFLHSFSYQNDIEKDIY